MGLPGHRRTHSDKHKRSAHFALKVLAISTCQKCSKPVLPHRACRACGFYRGREVVNTSRAVARLLKKASHAGHGHSVSHSKAGSEAPKAEAPKAKAKKTIRKTANKAA